MLCKKAEPIAHFRLLDCLLFLFFFFVCDPSIHNEMIASFVRSFIRIFFSHRLTFQLCRYSICVTNQFTFELSYFRFLSMDTCDGMVVCDFSHHFSLLRFDDDQSQFFSLLSNKINLDHAKHLGQLSIRIIRSQLLFTTDYEVEADFSHSISACRLLIIYFMR